jgi:beta-glucosidase
VDAGGRLPLTFPASLDQLPRPTLDGDPSKPELMFDVNYSEGAAVGYKGYDLKGLKPLFAFGHGLSYTSFRYDHLTANRQKGQVRVSFSVINTGQRDGRATPQLYVAPVAGGWEAPRRLAGWDKLTLKPGQTRQVSLTLDPRILATFKGGWRIAAGDYQLMLGSASDEITARTTVKLAAKRWSGAHR